MLPAPPLPPPPPQSLHDIELAVLREQVRQHRGGRGQRIEKARDLLVEHVGRTRDGRTRIREARRDHQLLATLPSQHEMRGTLLLDERRIHPTAAGEIARRHRDYVGNRQRGETFLQLAIRLLVHTGNPE